MFVSLVYFDGNCGDPFHVKRWLLLSKRAFGRWQQWKMGSQSTIENLKSKIP
jgi:hypothetical protein